MMIKRFILFISFIVVASGASAADFDWSFAGGFFTSADAACRADDHAPLRYAGLQNGNCTWQEYDSNGVLQNTVHVGSPSQLPPCSPSTWVHDSTGVCVPAPPPNGTSNCNTPAGTKMTWVEFEGRDVPFDPVADAKRFVDMRTPRVAGLPQTEPIYDELTKPTRVPVPAACIQFRGHCKCLSQQGTPIAVGEDMCVQFARNGFFQDFDPEGEKRRDVAVKSVEAPSRKVPGSSVQEGAGQQVVAFATPPSDPPMKLPATVLGAGH